MCDQSFITTKTNSSKAISALSSVTSLMSSLFPNGLDLSQINCLIRNLIQMSPNSTNSTNDSNNSTDSTPNTTNGVIGNSSYKSGEDHNQVRRDRHRMTERVRHNKIIELIRQLSESIGLTDRHATQASILNRSARYVLFLSHVIDKLEVDCNDNEVDLLSDEWLQSLYPLYQRAYEEASKLIQNSYDEDISVCGSDVSSQMANYLDNSLAETRDHCLPLIKLEIEK